MPTTVQIVGRRLEEEKILGVAVMLEKSLKEIFISFMELIPTKNKTRPSDVTSLRKSS